MDGAGGETAEFEAATVAAGGGGTGGEGAVCRGVVAWAEGVGVWNGTDAMRWSVDAGGG